MSNNISHEEVLAAPGITMFMIFLNTLITEGKAMYSPVSNKVILLNSDASNYFIMGRDQKGKPYIGLQESMVPWFLDIPWDEVILCPSEKYIYLVAKENGIPVFALGLKPRKKRMLTLNVPNVEDIKDTKVSFKLFKILAKELAVSNENAQKKELSARWEKSIRVIMEEDTNKEVPPEQEDLTGFTFINKGK